MLQTPRSIRFAEPTLTPNGIVSLQSQAIKFQNLNILTENVKFSTVLVAIFVGMYHNVFIGLFQVCTVQDLNDDVMTDV